MRARGAISRPRVLNVLEANMVPCTYRRRRIEGPGRQAILLGWAQTRVKADVCLLCREEARKHATYCRSRRIRNGGSALI